MIVRPDALKLLASLRTDEVVITCMKMSRQWPAFTNNDSLDYHIQGVMGLCPTVGLGVALAQPHRKVWVLNGDGSQLMYLSSIATIAAADVRNLVLFVFQNDMYESSGGQPLPLAGRLDFTLVARGLEISNAHSFSDLATLKARLPAILKEEGPALIVLKVVPGTAKEVERTDPVADVRKLKQALENRG